MDKHWGKTKGNRVQAKVRFVRHMQAIRYRYMNRNTESWYRYHDARAIVVQKSH